MTAAVLAFGSNLGDRAATIGEAVARVAAIDGVALVAASSLHESAAVKPHGVDSESPAYLNSVAIVDTVLTPAALLHAINGIENDLGRVRAERWADRTLDIDIVTFGDLEIATEALTVPHPRAAERLFVLEPWIEIDADARLPGRGLVRELLAARS